MAVTVAVIVRPVVFWTPAASPIGLWCGCTHIKSADTGWVCPVLVRGRSRREMSDAYHVAAAVVSYSVASSILERADSSRVMMLVEEILERPSPLQHVRFLVVRQSRRSSYLLRTTSLIVSWLSAMSQYALGLGAKSMATFIDSSPSSSSSMVYIVSSTSPSTRLQWLS